MTDSEGLPSKTAAADKPGDTNGVLMPPPPSLQTSTTLTAPKIASNSTVTAATSMTTPSTILASVATSGAAPTVTPTQASTTAAAVTLPSVSSSLSAAGLPPTGANPYMSYQEQLAFACSNLLFNQAILNATAAISNNVRRGGTAADVAAATKALYERSLEATCLSEMFQLPSVPDLFRMLPSSTDTTKLSANGTADNLHDRLSAEASSDSSKARNPWPILDSLKQFFAPPAPL